MDSKWGKFIPAWIEKLYKISPKPVLVFDH